MKKQIITLTVAALTLSSCGIYTKYKPATEGAWTYNHHSTGKR